MWAIIHVDIIDIIMFISAKFTAIEFLIFLVDMN